MSEDASGAGRGEDHGATPELDVDQADPDAYQPVGPSSKEGRSITIPALVVALIAVVYVIVVVLMR